MDTKNPSQVHAAAAQGRAKLIAQARMDSTHVLAQSLAVLLPPQEVVQLALSLCGLQAEMLGGAGPLPPNLERLLSASINGERAIRTALESSILTVPPGTQVPRS